MHQVDTDGTMLVKCACANCRHSFLTDDQAGDLTCPRCGFINEGDPVGGFEAPPPAVQDYGDEPQSHRAAPEPAFDMPAYFDPKEPPPLAMSWDNMARGILFGGILALAAGSAIGAALTATGIVIPGVAAVVMALATGAAVRLGMGGRTSSRTRAFALMTVLFAVVLGFGGIFTGSWLIDRFTGTRSAVTRKDLDHGRRELRKALARMDKPERVAERTILETRLRRAERLEALSDAQIEDYLWTQEAQINQPLAAYAKLRAMHAPLLKLGVDRRPVEAPKDVPLAILGAEFLLALLVAYQGVKPKR